MTRLGTKPIVVLSGPITLLVIDASGLGRAWTPAAAGPRIAQPGPGAVVWEAESSKADFLMHVEARMEFDGFVDFKLDVAAGATSRSTTFGWKSRWCPEAARYMMGLGFKGGAAAGEVRMGLGPEEEPGFPLDRRRQRRTPGRLRAENYSRPLNTNFYLSKPLNLPPSWWNEGRGGDGRRPGPGPAVIDGLRSGPRRIGRARHSTSTSLCSHAFQTDRPENPFRRPLLPLF